MYSGIIITDIFKHCLFFLISNDITLDSQLKPLNMTIKGKTNCAIKPFHHE